MRFRWVATCPNWRSRSISSTRDDGSTPFVGWAGARDFAPAPPARSTAVLTARVVVPTPPFGLKNVTISPVPGCAPRSAAIRPVRMRSAVTRPDSSVGSKPPEITSSAPASRNAMRASTSWAGATTRIGVIRPSAAVRSEAMAPDAASPSATIRSIGSWRIVATASAGVVTDATLWPASTSASSSSVRSSSPRAQMRIVFAFGRIGMLGWIEGIRASVYGRRRPALPVRPGTGYTACAPPRRGGVVHVHSRTPFCRVPARQRGASQTHREEVDGN